MGERRVGETSQGEKLASPTTRIANHDTGKGIVDGNELENKKERVITIGPQVIVLM